MTSSKHAGKAVRPTVDWVKIKAEYIEGYPDGDGTFRLPSLNEVAAKHGLNASYVRLRSSKGGWAVEREQWQSRRAEIRKAKMEEVERETAENIAKRVSELEAKTLLISEAGLVRVAKLMSRDGLKSHDIVALSTALRTFQQVYRLASNEPTDRTETVTTDPWAAIVAEVVEGKSKTIDVKAVRIEAK